MRPKILRTLKRFIKWLLGREVFLHAEVQVPTIRLGAGGDRWSIATDRLQAGMVLYTLGVGDDLHFERDVIRQFGLVVHAFDPTPASLAWVARQELPPGFTMHPYGVAGYDGTAKFSGPMKGYISWSLARKRGEGPPMELPVRRLLTLRRGLDLPIPDIIKMDIEGAEYDVLADLIATDLRPSQILVEFHHRFPEIGAKRTRQAVAMLRTAGYRLAYVGSGGWDCTFWLS